MFEFVKYDFNPETYVAKFRYRYRRRKFCEIVEFDKTCAKKTPDAELLDRALFLSFVLIGTSYYKAFPVHNVKLPVDLDAFQAEFFDHVYQEGLSQYAYENLLTIKDLAHFSAKKVLQDDAKLRPLPYSGSGKLVLQSGGKDSLLTAKLLKEPWTALYISSSRHHPEILDRLPAKNLEIIIRRLDHQALERAKKRGAKNGHVPVTYINMALALVQAILDDKSEVVTSIGHEGAEPHAKIGDLPVNHQWSKTLEAEKLFQEYVARYLSPDFQIYSPLRQYSELKIAKLFVKKCWRKYGREFSSCNVANYQQKANNQSLHWCGECAKCANSYLLFAPFVKSKKLNSLFPEQKSLLEKPELVYTFKGLLGVDGEMKPFECVGEVAELRAAYHKKRRGYPDLPFDVPPSNFDYNTEYPS